MKTQTSSLDFYCLVGSCFNGEMSSKAETSSPQKPSQGHSSEAAGCHVTRSDLPHIIGSGACFLCFIAYGACAALLGAALPPLSNQFHRSTSQLGVFFTARGIGFMVGTLAAAYILGFPNIPLSKEMMTCIGILISGSTLLVIDEVDDYVIAIIAFVIQGSGFGIIDTMANCALPEMWGTKRVQPWMQALHACFGIGAIIGPAIVGGAGYHVAFILVAITSFIPLISLVGYKSVTNISMNTFYGLLFQNDYDSSSHYPKINYDLEDDDRDVEVVEIGLSTIRHRSSESSSGKGSLSLEGSSLDDSNEVNLGNDGENSPNGQDNEIKAPLYLKLLMTSFFFIYVGAESGFAGWIPVYVLDEGVTDNESKAAYMSAIFWAALTVGRVLSIILAIFFSSTILIRMQLALGVLSCLLSVTVMTASYSTAAFVSGFVGFALSSMYPVMITLVENYGFKSESTTTTLLIVGSTLGEAIVPVCIGFLMTLEGPAAMPWSVFLSTITLVLIYVAIHNISLYLLSPSRPKRLSMNDLSEHSRHPLKGDRGASADGYESVINPMSGHGKLTKKNEEDEFVTIDFQ